MLKEALKVTASKLPFPMAHVLRTVGRLRSEVDKINKKMVPPHVALMELISGQWVAQAISTAAQLGVADHIPADNQAQEIGVLAQKIQCQAGPLYRLLRALCTVEIFFEEEGQAFRLTPMGERLRSDHPQSMRALSIFQGKVNWANWGDLEHSVRTGECAAEHVWGEKAFQHLAKHPEKAKVFDQCMTGLSKASARAISMAYDFLPYRVVCDIGGGEGALLSSILEGNSHLQGILFDMPHVLEKANPKETVRDRLDLRSGSFFDSVPEGADLYLLKHIIHDWSDEESIKILKNVKAQMPVGGKLLLIEAVIPERNIPHFSKFLDLEMLVVTTGKERTEEEFSRLLGKSGLKLERIIPTASLVNIIEVGLR